jgi:hypothetical protein
LDAYVFAVYVLGGAMAPQTNWKEQHYLQAFCQRPPLVTPLVRETVGTPFRPYPIIDAAWLD